MKACDLFIKLNLHLRIPTSVAVVAIVLLVLNIVQCRRHGKPFWIYRLVKSSGPHSLIVGNLGVLEPATTIFSCSILLAHLQDEYDTVFNHAALDQTATWRVSPWSSVFLQAWLTTWASLQAYILASPDNRYVRYLSARVYNGLFLAILGITGVALIVKSLLLTDCAPALTLPIVLPTLDAQHPLGVTGQGVMAAHHAAQIGSLLGRFIVVRRSSRPYCGRPCERCMV